MTDQSPAQRANSILATPQDKAAVLCSGMADPMQIPLEEPRDEFRRGGFLMLWCAVVAFWLCVGIAAANNWPWISATVAGWL